MRNPAEDRKDALVESLEGCGLSEEQLEKAEKFLRGEAGVCDLGMETCMPYEGTNAADRNKKMEKCFERLVKHKEEDLLKRYFEVVFQIFGVNLHPLYGRLYQSKSFIPGAKRIALQATQYAKSSWYGAGSYKNLLLATEKRELLLEAMTYTDKQYCNTDFIILTALFYGGMNEKPWNGKGLGEEAQTSQGVLGIFSNLLAGAKGEGAQFETSSYATKYPKEFQRYLAMFPEILGAVFGNTFSKEQMEAMRAYVMDGNVGKPVPGIVADAVSKAVFNEKEAKRFIGMAVANYRLSPVIYHFLKVCTYGPHLEQTLDAMVYSPCKEDMAKEILHWYADFKPDDLRFIRWLARGGQGPYAYGYRRDDAATGKVLAAMTKKNPEAYLEAVRTADTDSSQKLVDAAKQGLDQRFYKEKLEPMLGGEKESYRQKVMRQIVPNQDPQVYADSVAVLGGEKPMEVLYGREALLAPTSSYANVSAPLISYAAVYGEDEFYVRCLAFLGLRGMEYTLISFCREKDNKFSEKKMQTLLELLEKGGLDAVHRLKVGALIHDSYWGNAAEKRKVLEKVFAKLLEEHREEALAAFRNAPVTGRIIGIAILERNVSLNRQELYAYLGESSKQVKEELVKALAAHEECMTDLLETLKTSKKAAEREMAAAVLGKYKGIQSHQEELQAAMEKEKSQKVTELIRSILRAGGAPGMEAGGESGPAAGAEGAGPLTADAYVKECHKGGKKRGLAWIYESPMPEVHFAERIDELASEEYLQAMLLAYSGMFNPGINKDVRVLTDALNQQELAAYVGAVYEKWLSQGAEAKKKWVLYAASIHGGSGIVTRLQHQINEWAENSRGAIAAEAVKALTLNDSPMALMIVDGIARKYKFKQVRKAAQDAMQFAAAQLGLTVEELSDRIVPDLGFDERQQRIFDYGNRKFIVRIAPNLDIEVSDESGKKLKSLPAVGKQDDEAKAAQALSEFKELKKQMKATVKNQALRLELALSIDRRWTVDNWKRLFVNNPIMHQFAISLIWGYYENGALLQTFRYMEDGTFNTVDEEEYRLEGSGNVGLMHPVEMDQALITAWKEQLSDYEITQSVEQLGRPIFAVTEEEKGKNHLERFGGKMLNGLSLAGKLTGLGWNKGTPEDGGVYSNFCRKDQEAGYSVELRFSGSYIGDENDEVTVYDASFYSLEDMDKRGLRYDLKKDEKAILLDQTSARYFSEIVYQLTKATASSTETDEGWREN